MADVDTIKLAEAVSKVLTTDEMLTLLPLVLKLEQAGLTLTIEGYC